MVLRETYRPPQEYVPDIFPERFVSGVHREVSTRYQQAYDRLIVELAGRPPSNRNNLDPDNLQIDDAHRLEVANGLLTTGLLPHRGEIHSNHRLLTGSQATEQELTPDMHVLNLLAGARVATFLSDYHQILNGSIHRYGGTDKINDLSNRLSEKHRPHELYSMLSPTEFTGFGRNLFYSKRLWKEDKDTYTGSVDVYPLLTVGMLRDDVDAIKHQLGVKHPNALRRYHSNAREQTIRTFLRSYLGSRARNSPILLHMYPNKELSDCIRRWNDPHAHIARRDPFHLNIFTTAPRVRDHDIKWESTTLDEEKFFLILGFVQGIPYIGVSEGIGGGALAVGFEVRGRTNSQDVSDATIQAEPSFSYYHNPTNAEKLAAGHTRFTSVDLTPGLFLVQSNATITAR